MPVTRGLKAPPTGYKVFKCKTTRPILVGPTIGRDLGGFWVWPAIVAVVLGFARGLGGGLWGLALSKSNER